MVTLSPSRCEKRERERHTHIITVVLLITVCDFLFQISPLCSLKMIADTIHIHSYQEQVDYTRRSLVAKNHTATHILNYALRQVLGEKVDQKGSLVTEDKLRFDFSHGKPVEVKELRKIEEICNDMIQKSCVVHFRDVALDTAKAITGLRVSACLSSVLRFQIFPRGLRDVAVGCSSEDFPGFNLETLETLKPMASHGGPRVSCLSFSPPEFPCHMT